MIEVISWPLWYFSLSILSVMFYISTRMMCNRLHEDLLYCLLSIIGAVLFPYLSFGNHFHVALIYMRENDMLKEERYLWLLGSLWSLGFLVWITIGLYKRGIG